MEMIYFVLLGLGALLVLFLGGVALYFWWWAIIPICGLLWMGFVGFLLGLGLDVALFIVGSFIKFCFDGWLAMQDTRQTKIKTSLPRPGVKPQLKPSS